MINWKRKMRWGKSFFLAAAIVLISITTVSFTFKFHTFEEIEGQFKDLEHSLDNIHATLKIDSIRQYKINKIMSIMSKYNKKMPFEEKYKVAREIYRMSVKYSNLDIDLICATITHESALSWNPKVVSIAGAMGLMQIMPSTGIFLCRKEGIKWTTAEKILFDPIQNIQLGCRYLSTLIESYEIDGGLAAYNGGEQRASLWVKNNRDDELLWEETRGYIPAVLKLYEKFQKENGVL
jgi:soluble lytic murein transglycosylase